MTRPPLPPFTRETAVAEGAPGRGRAGTRATRSGSRWPTRVDSRWRNRAEFLDGRDEIVAFLTRKWARELDYRLIKELWAFDGNRIAVRFAYEWHDDSGTLVPLLRQRELGVRRRRPDARGATPASTTCRSPRPTASSTGRSAAAPTITPG